MVFSGTVFIYGAEYKYYAISPLIYNWSWSVHDTFNDYITRYNVYNDDYDSEKTAIYILYEYFGNSPTMGFQARDVSEGTSHIINVRAFPLSDWTLSRASNSNLVYFYANKATWCYVGNFTYDPNNLLDSILDGIDSQFTRTNFSSGNWFYLGNTLQPGTISIANTNGVSVSSKYPKTTSSTSNLTPDFVFTLDNTSSYNPDLPTQDILPPDSDNTTDINVGLFTDYLYYLIRSNFFYRDGNGALNSSWVPVSQYLTYDMFCKLQILSETVTVGDTVMPNYLNLVYGEMSAILTAIDSIGYDSSVIANMNENIQELTDGFNELYPEDARNMVSEIEDEIYDSNNGGISTNDLKNAIDLKSDADDYFGTGYSFGEGIVGLFSWSSDSEGWGFWSTSVQNDLDSPVNASLMEDDIVDFINSKDGEIDRKLGILNVSD